MGLPRANRHDCLLLVIVSSSPFHNRSVPKSIYLSALGLGNVPWVIQSEVSRAVEARAEEPWLICSALQVFPHELRATGTSLATGKLNLTFSR